MRRLIGLLLILTCWASAPQAQSPRLVYLTPVDGAGTDANQYRSRCLGMPGAGNIDLRPLGINRFVCASSELPKDTTGLMQLGSALDGRLSGATLTTLGELASKTLAATTVDGAIVELLRDRLKPSLDGKIKIYLGDPVPIYQKTAWVPFEDGGLVADASNFTLKLIEPALAWAASIAEDFNCSNSASLTCDLTWTEFTGTGWAIVSNQANSAVTAAAEARADSALASDDMEVMATLSAFSFTGGGFSRCGVIGRKENSASRTYYAFWSDGSATSWESSKRVAGSFTSLATNTTDPVGADVMKLAVDGSSVSGYVNGGLVTGPTTDTDISGFTYSGIYSHASTTTHSCTLDNFSAADIVVAASAHNRRAVHLP